MTITKDALIALQTRLSTLAASATAEELAYLGKAMESVAGQSTVLDVMITAEEQQQTLADAATGYASDINAAKTSAISAVQTEGTTITTAITTAKNTAISAVQTEGATQIQAIEAINTSFGAVNDVPNGSTIMNEINKKGVLNANSLPFIFGILSRNNDSTLGKGGFTNELGAWATTTNGDHMLQLLTGAHNYSEQYMGFYRPPQLHFLQGKKGEFMFRELFNRYAYSSTSDQQYMYPYALLGVFFVKNTTASPMTRTFSFGGSSYWQSTYEGSSILVGTPNQTNSQKENITALSWVNAFNYTASTNNYGGTSTTITIAADKTVAIIFYTTPYYVSSVSSGYAQFMNWYVSNFRSLFLTTGLEIDYERTLKAWQCPGYQNTFEIWK